MTASVGAQPDTAGRLRLVVGRLHRRLRQQGSGGLTLSQLSALATVEEHQPLRLGDLAAREGVAAPTATRVAAALEDAGLVTRRTASDDRRSAVLSLTAAGRRTIERLRAERTAFLARQIARLTAEQAATLAAALPVLELLVDDEA